MEASPLLPVALFPVIINVIPPTLPAGLDMSSDLMATESKTDPP